MTYCCGILVRDGVVLSADTRTNAGLDNISTFRKLHIFERSDERILMIASAGNLSITQNVITYLAEGLEQGEGKAAERLIDMPSMFAAAQLIGRAVRKVRDIDNPSLSHDSISFDVSFLFAGQIKGQPMQLFMIYAAGNFIEATIDTPYLQIGEHKYGKPVLDRAVTYETDIYDALKLALISMDSTMRSNLGVGMPLDIAVLRRDALALEVNTRIDNTDAYFHDLRDRWSTALRQAHMAIPRPPYAR